MDDVITKAARIKGRLPETAPPARERTGMMDDTE